MSVGLHREVRLGDVVSVLWLRKALVTSVTAVLTMVFMIVAFVMTPTYKVEILLAPTIADSTGSSGAALVGQLGGLASLAGIDLGASGGVKEEAIALLQSRVLTRQFIADHNLMPVLFADRWNADVGDWRSNDSGDIPTMWMSLKKFDTIRTVTENQKTGLVKLTVEWSDPQVAARWASELVIQVNEAMRTRAIEEANRSMEFLQERLLETEAMEVRQAIYALLEGQTKSLMMADVRSEYAFKILDPAVIPDLNDPTAPRKFLIVAAGIVLGLMAGVLLALMPIGVLGRRDAETTRAPD